MNSPLDIVSNMLQLDTYSNWLGIQIVSITEGSCTLQMHVRNDMLNGHGIAHGGISYALADSALAFAANSAGQKAVSIETAIAHIASIQLNDTLIAYCTEVNRGKTIARYDTTIYNQDQKLVAKFHGTVHRSNEKW
jgi:acyl-CoA thioesterase